jgi:hypothetical protein
MGDQFVTVHNLTRLAICLTVLLALFNNMIDLGVYLRMKGMRA